jgi:hypothetical protein
MGYATKADGVVAMWSRPGGYYVFSGDTAPRTDIDAAHPSGLVRKSQMETNLARLGLGGFRSLKVSATGTNANVTVAADAIVLLDANGQADLRSNISLTAGLSPSLDAGSVMANTWYSVWVISNVGNGGNSDAIWCSLSATSPVMPAGWTHKARVGWIRTDGTGNPFGFKQKGRRAQWVVAPGTNLTAQPVMASGIQGNVTTGTWVSVDVSGFVPPTASCIRGVVANSAAPAGTTMAHPNANAGAYNSLTLIPAVSVSIGVGSRTIMPFDFVLEGSSIYYAADQADSRAYSTGWEDNL